MIPSTLEASKSPRTSRQARALILLAVAAATGCASTRAAVEQYDRDSALQLDAPAAWARFEVRRTSFKKKLEFRDLATGESWEMKYKGTPYSRITPVGIFVPERIYKHRAVRGRFRLEHPFSHQPLVLRARAISQSVGRVPLPPEAGPPVVEILGGDEQPVRGTLTYDVHSLIVFSGKIGEHEVEIEQQNEGAQRPDNPWEYMVAPFPIAGEFVVRIDGRVAARFLKRVPRGTVHAYELALPTELASQERDDAALAFVVFVLMEELISSLAG